GEVRSPPCRGGAGRPPPFWYSINARTIARAAAATTSPMTRSIAGGGSELDGRCGCAGFSIGSPGALGRPLMSLAPYADNLNRKRNAADKREGQTREARHAGRNLHAPTGSGSASGQGSGQQLAVRPDHTAVCEGVLDSRRIDSCFYRKRPDPSRTSNGPGLVISPPLVGWRRCPTD